MTSYKWFHYNIATLNQENLQKYWSSAIQTWHLFHRHFKSLLYLLLICPDAKFEEHRFSISRDILIECCTAL